VTGFAACFTSLAYSFFLNVYYETYRPVSPQPERGWTVGLTWTHPTKYGTEQEENRQQWVHWSVAPFFILIAAAEAIKIYKFNDYSGIWALRPHQ
jgi:hypothetical protein